MFTNCSKEATTTGKAVGSSMPQPFVALLYDPLRQAILPRFLDSRSIEPVGIDTFLVLGVRNHKGDPSSLDALTCRIALATTRVPQGATVACAVGASMLVLSCTV